MFIGNQTSTMKLKKSYKEILLYKDDLHHIKKCSKMQAIYFIIS